MTENLNPETDTPELETFNIEDWLTTGETAPKRTTESVTVYRDVSLVDEARQMAMRVAEAQAKQKEGAGDPDASVADEDPAQELMRQQEELDRRLRAAKATVTIQAVSDREAEDIAASFRQRFPGEKRNFDETNKGFCMVLAQAATFNGQKLSADQWSKLSEGPLAGGQWQAIKRAHISAQNRTPRVHASFSQSS